MIRQLPSQGLSFQLWPATNTLVTLLDHHCCDPSNSPLSSTLLDQHRSLNILKLGFGTGLVGIAVAATLGANVMIIDLPHVITNLQFNVEANATVLAASGGTVHMASLRWGEVDDVNLIGQDFDLVLTLDVVYHDPLNVFFFFKIFKRFFLFSFDSEFIFVKKKKLYKMCRLTKI